MRFLMLTTKYPIEHGHSWMSSDLADELVRRGHQVDVVLIDWNAAIGRATRTVATAGGVNVVDIAPRAFTRVGKLGYRISKMLLSPRHARAEMARHIDTSQHDAVIAFTPASTLAQPIEAAANIKSRILFVFDFYPIYQKEIGLVPGGPIFRWALRREERLYRMFDTLVCTLPSNARYLSHNYRVTDRQRVQHTPLWSDTSPVAAPPRVEIRKRYNLPDDRMIAVFGGQITDGRGVELMLDAAAHAELCGSTMLFLFVGDGRLTGLVDTKAEVSSNVRRLSGLAREEYLELAAACDVGLVATVPGVSSFNSPTKTIDYLRAGLPVVAAVEPGNDYVDILTTWGVGEGVDFTDPEAFFDAAKRLSSDPEIKAAIADRARQCLDAVFDVRHAADLTLSAIARTQEA